MEPCTTFALADVDLLFIENVGNLVCPASFDLGQHRNVVLLSVPEGDDKPEKYPVMFRAADLVLITKADLLEHIPEFDLQRARGSLQSIASAVPVLELSARRETGMDAWIDWLHAEKLANDSANCRARAGNPRTCACHWGGRRGTSRRGLTTASNHHGLPHVIGWSESARCRCHRRYAS